MSERVLILGATGLVGTEVLGKIQKLTHVKEIFALTRRPINKDLKFGAVKECVVDFDNLDGDRDYFSVDTVICALGTTIKKAGSQAAFRKVDYEYPLKVARLAKARGASQFLLVSSLGASPDSKVFYSRTKGELERDLEKIGFAKLVIVRPSILLGDRAEVRMAEQIGQKVSRFLPRQWRGVSAERVAEILIRSIDQHGPSLKIIENAEIAL